MADSVTSVFGESDDLQAALRGDGVLSLLVSAHGDFRARLTQVRLQDLHLSAGDENLSRVAFLTVPEDTLLVSLSIGDRTAPIWGGLEMQTGDLVTIGAGQRVHARTNGPCRWAAIRLSSEGLIRYGRVLSGANFTVPHVAQWRPRRAALRQLRHFHRAAVRKVEAWSGVFADGEAAHGFEQQLIHALFECLSGEPIDEGSETTLLHQNILARFEDLLAGDQFPGIGEICAVLGISRRLLGESCNKYLGMDPDCYRRLRGMQRARRAFRSEAGISRVSQIVMRYGLGDPGRFAGNYRAWYGEFPSETVRGVHLDRKR